MGYGVIAGWFQADSHSTRAKKAMLTNTPWDAAQACFESGSGGR